jgi:hypothetical protein
MLRVYEFLKRRDQNCFENIVCKFGKITIGHSNAIFDISQYF